ncbi:hypothetical protein LMG28690_00101 [Paraburkholderia caffeinilytica]|nr:hypothetical protein LMG28690_00101 [Paraburkholderia caffeinilytica]
MRVKSSGVHRFSADATEQRNCAPAGAVLAHDLRMKKHPKSLDECPTFGVQFNTVGLLTTHRLDALR